MNSCLWPAVYLSKDTEVFTCAIQKKEEREVGTIFETVQAQICNLTYCDQEISRLDEAVDWTSCHYSLLEKKIAAQFTSKVNVFHDSVLCLVGICQEHPEAAKTRIREFVLSPEVTTILRSHKISTGIRVEYLRGKDDD